MSDKLYASKILYTVDTRIQGWLSGCKIAKERANIDDSIVDFKYPTNDILNGRFSMDLPPVFMINPSANQRAGGPSTSDDPPTKKAKRNGERGEDKRVPNNHQFDAFKMNPKDDWKIFCGEV